MDILNLSLLQPGGTYLLEEDCYHPCAKENQGVPNDYYPVALTLPIMKCFESMFMSYINSSLPDSLGPLYFVYHCNWSTAHTISLTLHSSLEQLDIKDTSYLLTTSPSYSNKTHLQIPGSGIQQPLCIWILNLLT